MNEKKRIEVSEKIDIAYATDETMRLADKTNFSLSSCFMIATSVSELATNIYRYAEKGHILVKIIENEIQNGIEIVAKDNGPGIEDVEAAMQDNFTTSPGSLGMGLPGVKRLMDEFEIESQKGVGTTVTARKWIKKQIGKQIGK